MSVHSLRRTSASFGAVLVAVVSLGLVASPAALASGPPVGKLYDCWNFDRQSGFNNFVQAVELKTKSVYLVDSRFDLFEDGQNIMTCYEH